MINPMDVEGTGQEHAPNDSRISRASNQSLESPVDPNSKSGHSITSGLTDYDGFLVSEERPHEKYNYFSLYRFCSSWEFLLLTLGLICALLSGICVPLMVIQFGRLTNTMVIIDVITHNNTAYEARFTHMNRTPFCEPREYIRPIEGTKTEPNKTNKIAESVTEFAEIHSYIAIVLTILSAIYFMSWFYCGEKQINRLTANHFEALLRKDMKWLDLAKDHDFSNSIVENASRIREGIGEQVTIAIALFSIFVFSLMNAFWHGWKLASVSTLAIPIFLISTSIVASAEANQIVEEQTAYSRAGGLAEEVLLNIKTVMVYGGQKKEFHQFNEFIGASKLKIVKRTFLTSLANGAMWFITYGNYALSFWYGTKLVIDSQTIDCATGDPYSPEDLIVIFFSIYFGALNIGLAFPIVQSMMVANKSAKEVLFTIDSKVEVDNLSGDGLIPKNPASGRVEIQDVYFSYPARKDVPILNGVSLAVNPGMTCALVGSSGCGKSTILKLLTKEYLADSGFINVDGVDIRSYSTHWLRNQIAFVTQEGSLFDATIEENIRYGKPDATLEEIERVCKEVNAHEFISELKKGYQTQVGFQGGKLSGGQRQRIAIARALLRDPKILLLDEPTSALDNQSEAVVQKALMVASKNRTTFVVAHRLNTIKNADKIIVFHKGKIVEQGTHSELFNLKGHYYQLATGHDESSKSPKAALQRRRKSTIDLEAKLAMDSAKLFSASARFPFRASLTTTSPFNETIVKHAKHLQDLQKEYEDNQNNVSYTIKPRRNTIIRFADDNNLDIEQQEMSLAGRGVGEGQLPSPTGSEHETHISTLKRESEVAALHLLENEERLWKHFTRKNFVKVVDPVAFAHTKFGFLKILKMVSHSHLLLLIGIIASICVGCTLPLYGILFGNVVGELGSLDEHQARKTLEEYSYWFLGVGVAAAISVFVQSMALNLAGYKTIDGIRKWLFFTFLRQDCGWFDDPDNNVATLNTRLNVDAGSTQYIILSFYGAFFQCVATIIISISYSAAFGDGKLTAYCLFLVPIVIGSSLVDGWLGKIQQDRTTDAMDEISKLVLEVFQNRHAVLTCQLETHFLTKFKVLLTSTGKSQFKLIIMRSLAFGFAQASVFWSYSICMYLSKNEIIKGEVKYQNVLIVGEALIFGLLTVGSSLAIIPSFTKALGAASRLVKLLSRKPNFDVETDGTFVEKCDGRIEFKDVQFWYPHAPGIKILKGISFTVTPGQMIALVGSSGSGKSTCVQLILRFHDSTGGFVEIDGRHICDLNAASLRSHMALVAQEPRLFDRTVAENIAYGDNSKPIKLTDIIKAAKAANIHTFVTSLPEGYETKTGPTSGSFLSGGQKQRIAIARALLRKPKILILDEATSALDRDSEKLVQESIELAREGRTCIAIAHRLVSIQNADLIIVMHQGAIVEFGTHKFLLQNDGLYSLLWNSQNPTQT